MAGIYEINHAPDPRRKQSTGPQAVEPSRKSLKRPRHTVVGTITRQMQAQIVSELRGGRSAVQVAKAYSVAVDVVLELFIRSVEREVLALRRMAA